MSEQENNNAIAKISQSDLKLIGKLEAQDVNMNPIKVTFDTEGESRRGYFTQIADMESVSEETGEIETYSLAVFAGYDKENGVHQWMAGGANLISGARTLVKGHPYEVTYVENRKLSGGRALKVFRISPLVAATKSK